MQAVGLESVPRLLYLAIQVEKPNYQIPYSIVIDDLHHDGCDLNGRHGLEAVHAVAQNDVDDHSHAVDVIGTMLN